MPKFFLPQSSDMCSDDEPAFQRPSRHKNEGVHSVTPVHPIGKSRLLSLPLHIRKRILQNSELVRPCPISFECESRRVLWLRRWGWASYQGGRCFRLNENYQKPIMDSSEIWWNDEEDAQWKARSRYEIDAGRRGINDPLGQCDHEPMPIALMSVCKQLSLEATEILYSENAFSLNCYDRAARRSFFDLSDQAVASLRRLHVIYLPDRDPIQQNDPIFERFQEPWERVCKFLSEKVSPGQLRLSLECFVQDLATQKTILEPLLRLPKLRHIRINIGHFKDPKFEKISKSVADSIVTKPYDGMTFPFERLSLELQELVIFHSSLVVNKDAVQNPSRRLEYLRGITIDTRGRPHPATGICCGTCDENYLWCWCNRYGDGKYSSSCSCPRLSAGLFSTNKHIADLAIRAFYGNNQFYIDGSISRTMGTLSRIPAQRLSYINRLCLDGAYLSDRFFDDWKNLIDYLGVRAHPDLAVKILNTDPWMFMEFGGKDSFTRLTNFRRWFRRLRSKRVSVLAPSRNMPPSIDCSMSPYDHTWVTIAGPPATFRG